MTGGIVEGGASIDSIPTEARAKLDLRSESTVRLDELGYTDLSDTLAEMKIRARDAAFNFPYLYDGDIESISRSYGPVATPHAFGFDAERKLRYVGRIDDSERESLVKTQDLRLALDAVLAGRAPEPAQTKAFGCSIKWAGKQDQVKTFMEKLSQEPVTVEPVDAAGLGELRKGEGTKVRLINFWATWCPPCMALVPHEIALVEGMKDRPFALVGVNGDELDETVRKRIADKKITWRSFKNEQPDQPPLSEIWDIGGWPTMYVVDAKGVIRHIWLGSPGEKVMDESIEKLVKEAEKK